MSPTQLLNPKPGRNTPRRGNVLNTGNIFKKAIKQWRWRGSPSWLTVGFGEPSQRDRLETQECCCVHQKQGHCADRQLVQLEDKGPLRLGSPPSPCPCPQELGPRKARGLVTQFLIFRIGENRGSRAKGT